MPTSSLPAGPARRSRLVVALVAGAAAITSVPPAHAAGCAAVRRFSGGWTRIAWPESADQVVGGALPTRLFAARGDTILRSTDSGCTWKAVYTFHLTEPAGDPADPVTAARLAGAGADVGVLAVATAQPRAGRDTVYATFASLALGLGDVPFVAASDDGGTTWHTTIVGAPSTLPGGAWTPACCNPSGGTNALVVFPADPRVAFLTLGSSGIDSHEVTSPSTSGPYIVRYLTKDAGRTWSYEGGASDVVFPDPVDATTLWRTYGNALQRSTNYGRTWSTVSKPPLNPLDDYVDLLDVLHLPGRPAQLLLRTNSPRFKYSRDAGRTWSDVPAATPLSRGTGTYATTPVLTAGGDVVAWISLASAGAPAGSAVYRWSAATRRWTAGAAVPPTADGAATTAFGLFVPVDTTHRYLVGTLVSSNSPMRPLAVYDTAARP